MRLTEVSGRLLVVRVPLLEHVASRELRLVRLGGGEVARLDEAHELGDVGRNAVVVLVAKRERAAALP